MCVLELWTPTSTVMENVSPLFWAPDLPPGNHYESCCPVGLRGIRPVPEVTGTLLGDISRREGYVGTVSVGRELVHSGSWTQGSLGRGL